MSERPISHRKQPGKIEANRAKVIGGREARANKPTVRRGDCACSLV